MPIIRSSDRPVAVNRFPFSDSRLSFAARGVFAYLATRDPDTEVTADDLIAASKDAYDAAEVRKSLVQLAELGYIELADDELVVS